MTLREYAKVLKEYKGPQCQRSYVEGDSCCALGVIVKFRKPEVTHVADIGADVMAEIGEIRHKLRDMSISVIVMNDLQNKTFKEIGDTLDHELNLRGDK